MLHLEDALADRQSGRGVKVVPQRAIIIRFSSMVCNTQLYVNFLVLQHLLVLVLVNLQLLICRRISKRVIV
jgi:hypothetical protein